MVSTWSGIITLIGLPSSFLPRGCSSHKRPYENGKVLDKGRQPHTKRNQMVTGHLPIDLFCVCGWGAIRMDANCIFAHSLDQWVFAVRRLLAAYCASSELFSYYIKGYSGRFHGKCWNIRRALNGLGAETIQLLWTYINILTGTAKPMSTGLNASFYICPFWKIRHRAKNQDYRLY